jgi:hypothetical protein
MFRNPADILNYGGIKCYSVYWVRTRGRVVAGSKYYLNKNKNKNKDSIIASSVCSSFCRTYGDVEWQDHSST